MNKKVWIGFIVVFVAMVVLNFIVHGLILSSTYQTVEVSKYMRPKADMDRLMWVYYIIYLIQSFFFSFIFSKGYEGKGIAEGIRYGLYMGLLLATPMAYASYATYPMPYSLAFQWFIYGIICYIILGILLAAIFGKKAKETQTN